jgi:hypothetical protein
MCAYSPFLIGFARRTHQHDTNEPLLASTDAATTATEGTPTSVPVTRPARQNSLSAETLQTLEKRLAHRPERQELQDRNILKGVPSSPLYASYSLMPVCLTTTTIVVDRGKCCSGTAGCERTVAKVTA